MLEVTTNGELKETIEVENRADKAFKFYLNGVFIGSADIILEP